MEINKITSLYVPSLSSGPLAPGRSSWGLHICTHFSNNNTFSNEGLKADNRNLLNEQLSGYWSMPLAYFVRLWINSWTVHFPCLMVLNLFNAWLCIKVFKKQFCNPLKIYYSDQVLIGLSCLSTFLIYHSRMSLLSLVPKYSTWNMACLVPRRPFIFSQCRIPVTKVL